VIHSLVVLLVLTQLSFAGLFLWDLKQTSDVYNALVAHRVAVTGHLVGCFNIYQPDNCYVTYKYDGQKYSAWIEKNYGVRFYVDPRNTSYRMNKAIYDGADENIYGDAVIASLLLSGALLMTASQQYHLYRRRTMLRNLPHEFSGSAAAHRAISHGTHTRV
jgi:hypothetical protein